jgi:hypothetical protein
MENPLWIRSGALQLIAQVPVVGASSSDGAIVRHTHRGLVRITQLTASQAS